MCPAGATWKVSQVTTGVVRVGLLAKEKKTTNEFLCKMEMLEIDTEE
jgi:hypothetical protein